MKTEAKKKLDTQVVKQKLEGVEQALDDGGIEPSTAAERQGRFPPRIGYEDLRQDLVEAVTEAGFTLPALDPQQMLVVLERADALEPLRKVATRVLERIEDAIASDRAEGWKIFLGNYKMLSSAAELNAEVAQKVAPIVSFMSIGARPKTVKVDKEKEVTTPVVAAPTPIDG